MKKFMLMGALVALVAAAVAFPALAQDRFFEDGRGAFERGFDQGAYEDNLEARQDYFEDYVDEFEDRYEDYEDEGLFALGDRFFEEEGFFLGEDGFFFDDERFDEDDDFGGDSFDSGISQSFDQEADSGDVSQSFNVSNTGDNSNQCVGLNSSVNTGNIQNQTGLVQYGSEIGDFEIEDSGSSINVGGTSTVTCDQQVNQAAAAGY
jgi:hypothetical protein